MVLTTKRFYIIRIILFFIFFSSFFRFTYAKTSQIGKIDLSLALLLHPKMCLFDFNKLGFYKVSLKQINKDFNNKLLELKKNSIDRTLEIATIKEKISELYLKIEKKLSSDNTNEEIIILKEQILELKYKVSELEFESENPEITNIKETREILSNINKEINEAIKEVAKKNNMKIVFNDWVPYKRVFPNDYIDRSGFKNRGANIFSNFYQVFFAKAAEFAKTDGYPSSNYLSYWLEHARCPDQINNIPFNSQSLIIFGAKDIMSDVLEIIYKNYNLYPDTFNRLNKVLKNYKEYRPFLLKKDE